MSLKRSFSIKDENVVRLKDIQEQLGLDNPNMTLNYIIETYAECLKLRPAFNHLTGFIEAIRSSN